MPEMRERFESDTGISLRPARSGLEAAIDEATGQAEDAPRKFIAWWSREIWGEEWTPDDVPGIE